MSEPPQDQRTSLEAVLLEWAPDALVVVDGEGTIRLTNRRTSELFGYREDELVGQKVELLIPERSRDRHPGLRAGYVAQPSVRPMGAGLQLWGLRRDGSQFPVDISLSPIDSPGGTFVAAAIRDISDRLATQEALRQARDEAQFANRAKSDFLSRMSHELRTPLTAILGFAELLGLEDVESGQRQEFVDRIQRAGQHLLTLIDDTLDISRVEAGTMDLSVESLPVDELIEDAVGLIGPLATPRGVRFELSLQPLPVVADRNRLRQVLINLLSNAVKYNRRDGTVDIRVEQVGSRIQIRVCDTGEGIAPDDLDRLFEPFERLGAEVEGTGIGLALSRGLVELMDGTITVVSELGVGSTFTVDLPIGHC